MQKLLERRPSLVLISLIIAVLISLLFTSCATYENKKATAVMGQPASQRQGRAIANKIF